MKKISVEILISLICILAMFSSLLFQDFSFNANLALCLFLHALNSWGVYRLSLQVMDLQGENYWSTIAAFFFAFNPIAIETIYRNPNWQSFLFVFISLAFCIYFSDKFKRAWPLFLMINFLPIIKNKFFIPQMSFVDYASSDKFLVNLLDPFGFITPVRIDYKHVETKVDFFQFSSMLSIYGLSLFYAYKNKNFIGSFLLYTVYVLLILCLVYFFPSSFFYRNFYSAQILLAIAFSAFCFFLISYLDKRATSLNLLVLILLFKGTYEIKKWNGVEHKLMAEDAKFKDQSEYVHKFETFYKKKMYAEALNQFRYLDLKNTIKFDAMLMVLDINLGLGDIDAVQNTTIAMIDHFPKEFKPHVFYYMDKLSEYGRPEIAVLYMTNVHKSMSIPPEEYEQRLVSYKVALKNKRATLIKNLARYYKQQNRLEDMELALRYSKSVDL